MLPESSDAYGAASCAKDQQSKYECHPNSQAKSFFLAPLPHHAELIVNW